MRFVPYGEIHGQPNIIVDGAACAGTVLTLSHWPQSGTPPALRRDSSAEIAFAYLDSPQFHVAVEIVSNNHFDQDGLVGLYALLHPVAALTQRQFLIDVAWAGDFGVYRSRGAARVSISMAIAALADASLSPLPKNLFELPDFERAGRLYEQLLELFPALIRCPENFRNLWKEEDTELEASEQLLANGTITIQEFLPLDLAVVRLPESLGEHLSHRFAHQRRLERCHPFAINSRTAATRLLLVQGRRVEFEYRYESWVQFVSRRPLPRVDLSRLAAELNEQETSGGRWVFDGVEQITPRLHLTSGPDRDAALDSSLSPETILERLRSHLASGAPAWDPYD